MVDISGHCIRTREAPLPPASFNELFESKFEFSTITVGCIPLGLCLRESSDLVAAPEDIGGKVDDLDGSESTAICNIVEIMSDMSLGDPVRAVNGPNIYLDNVRNEMRK